MFLFPNKVYSFPNYFYSGLRLTTSTYENYINFGTNYLLFFVTGSICFRSKMINHLQTAKMVLESNRLNKQKSNPAGITFRTNSRCVMIKLFLLFIIPLFAHTQTAAQMLIYY